MSTENIARIVTRQAGTNVTNHRFVKEAAAGIVNRADTQGEEIFGIIAARSIPENASSQAITSGDEAPVATAGDIELECGAAVADQAEVMTDNAGRGITFAAGAGALAVGKNISVATTVAGQLMTLRLYPKAQHA